MGALWKEFMTPSNETIETIETILELLRSSEKLDYIGEPVSQLTHALQCGFFAERAGARDEEILAALLHDVGHYCGPGTASEMGGYGVRHHETVGADYLKRLGFSEEVAELIKGHVEAKRYLVWKNLSYGARLSEASARTLEYQGGPMTDGEAKSFEKDPYFSAKLRVRHFDEQAKAMDLDVPDIEYYRPLIARHLACRNP